MQALRIVNWFKNYEATNKGHRAREDTTPDDLKRGPLEYIRFKVMGLSIGPEYMEITRQAPGALGMAVFGLFAKLLEVAACQKSENRGWILDNKQRPCDAKKISSMLLINDEEFVKQALDILADEDIGWIETAEFGAESETDLKGFSCENESFPAQPGNPGNPREIPAAVEDIENPSRIALKSEAKNKEVRNKSEDIRTSGEDEENSPSLDSSNFSSLASLSRLSGPEVNDHYLKVWLIWRTTIRDKLRMVTPADDKTMRGIFEHIWAMVKSGQYTIGIFERIFEKAEEARKYGQKPIAQFVYVMKQDYGYVTVKMAGKG